MRGIKMRGIKRIISTLVVMSMCFSLVAVMPVSADTQYECTPYTYMGTADRWYVNENFNDRTANNLLNMIHTIINGRFVNRPVCL